MADDIDPAQSGEELEPPFDGEPQSDPPPTAQQGRGVRGRGPFQGKFIDDKPERPIQETRVEFFSGLLPHPGLFNQYSDEDRKFLRNEAATEAQHIRSEETEGRKLAEKGLNRQFDNADRGQKMAGGIALGLLMVTVVGLYTKAEIVAGLGLVGVIGQIGVALIQGASSRKAKAEKPPTEESKD